MLQFVLGLVKFHHEINILKSILNKKSYPHDFVDKCIKMFLDRVLMYTTILGKLSLQIFTWINGVVKTKTKLNPTAIFELYSSNCMFQQLNCITTI